VGGVGRTVIVEDDVLLVLGALDDFRRALVQLGLDLVDNRHHDRSKETEDEDVELVLYVFDEIWQDWDLLDCFGDFLHDLIVPLNSWVDILGHLLHLASEGLWLTRGDMYLGHLCSCRVDLQLVRLASLVFAAK
jgi:hypothetical protein